MSATGGWVCPHCGTRGRPTTKTPGSILIEVVLWLCFIVPGVIYSLWRHAARVKVCRHCRQPGLVPCSTPRGQQLIQQFGQGTPP